MLSHLQQGLKSFFEKEDGAYEKTISWTCQEKFRPGPNDLALIFPNQKDKNYLADYVRAMIFLVSGWIGLEAEDYAISGSSGSITLSPGGGRKIIIIVNCAEGRKRGYLLLRMYGHSSR
jgi:hypothetical protein